VDAKTPHRHAPQLVFDEEERRFAREKKKEKYVGNPQK
jgi:hypothetical protein